MSPLNFPTGPTTAAKQVATRNILAPLLWMDAIISAPAILAMPFAPANLLLWYLLLAFVPPGFTLLAYLYWTFREPDRLQSEQYLLEKRWYDNQVLIGDNRTKEVLELTAQQVPPTANTAIGDTNG